MLTKTRKKSRFASNRATLIGSLRLPSTASALATLVGLSATAYGQETPRASDELEEIVVTGTSIRGVTPVGSAAISLGSDSMKEEGLSRPADLVRILPQLQTSNIRESSAGGIAANSTRGQAFNLRGLGSGGTLLLIDGHRIVPNGAADVYQDANQIPLIAIERVEVVTDGASAIYGADAVGGVVNYILKKDFEGMQARLQYGEQLSAPGWEASLVGGNNFMLGDNKGNILLSYRHGERDPVMRNKSRFLSANLSPLGGNDTRINGTTVTAGSVPLLAINTGSGVNYYAIPAGNGTGLTAASLTPGLGNLATDIDNYPYLGEETQDSVTAYLSQDLSDSFSVYVEGFYNKRKVKIWRENPEEITIPPTNPLYITGLGAIPGGQIVNYRFPDQIENTFEETWSGTVGGKLQVGGNWEGELYSTYGDNRNCGQCRSYANSNAYLPLVASGALNPFSSQPLTAAQIAATMGPDIDSSNGSLWDTVLKFNGPLFGIPGGEVRAAVGFEHTKVKAHYENWNTNTPTNTRFFPRPPVDLDRDVDSAFTEIYVPVVGSGNEMTLVHSLSLSGAVRYDKYSDFGNSTTPKFGVTWQPTEDLSFRGTWGKSFKAPSLQQANSGTIGNSFFIPFFVNGTGDPRLPRLPGSTNSMVMLMAGGNTNLEAEKAETYSFGFDYAPQWLDGMRVSATYYNIDYRDRIANVPAGTFLSTPATFQTYQQYITVAPQPPGCVVGDFSTYAPEYRAAIADDPFVILFGGLNDCASVAILDARVQNIGKVKQNGIDFQVQYQRDVGFGDLSVGAMVTKILTLDQSLIPNAPLVDVLDTVTYPNSLRVRGNLGISRGGLRASLFLNHVGDYVNNTPISLRTTPPTQLPTVRIPSWTTYDASVGYEFGGTAGFLEGAGVNLNVQNITDKDPPVVHINVNAVERGFDELNANPFGRYFQVELYKTF